MLFVALCSCCAVPVVLVTGATGRSGYLVYKSLKEKGAYEVRALARSIDKARSVLKCNACNASDGVFVGDVTKPETLTEAFKNVDTLVDAVGVPGTPMPQKEIEAVEFEGVKNQVAALASSGSSVEKRQVVMISSEGTTGPPSGGSDNILFYKLNAEAFLMSSGLEWTIVKPCGLSEATGGQSKLLVGHDDSAPWEQTYYMIPRADVAGVVAAAVEKPQDASGMRFDLCSCAASDSKCPAGAAPGSYDTALKNAKWPWMAEAEPEAEVPRAKAPLVKLPIKFVENHRGFKGGVWGYIKNAKEQGNDIIEI